MKPPQGAETVEMVDGRLFWSLDRWATIYEITRSGRGRQVPVEKADLVRFLAVSQSSWAGDAG